MQLAKSCGDGNAFVSRSVQAPHRGGLMWRLEPTRYCDVVASHLFSKVRDFEVFDHPLLGPILKIAFRPSTFEMVVKMVDARKMQLCRLQQRREFRKAQIPPQLCFRLWSITKKRVNRVV